MMSWRQRLYINYVLLDIYSLTNSQSRNVNTAAMTVVCRVCLSVHNTYMSLHVREWIFMCCTLSGAEESTCRGKWRALYIAKSRSWYWEANPKVWLPGKLIGRISKDNLSCVLRHKFKIQFVYHWLHGKTIRKNNVIPGIYLCNENISDQNVVFWKICFKEIHFTPKCFFLCILTPSILRNWMVYNILLIGLLTSR